jgi:hypothetical protein
LIKIITLDIEKPIPAGTIIFERDVSSQLHQLFFRKLVAQTRVQLIGDIRWRVRKGISQLNHQSFSIIERRKVAPENSVKFLIAQTCFSANGRIDVYSKRASNASRSANSSQLDMAQ